LLLTVSTTEIGSDRLTASLSISKQVLGYLYQQNLNNLHINQNVACRFAFAKVQQLAEEF